ncbi:GNAT family N-acetyltransferase [Paenibacillus humicola]|uniref:GNAT family N-acetyltransferase n=1 Tax=Paenibacillus humicola TaxID=3110540 RepID=UPI00237AD494|nr:GNAT family N-acetyltransferase [Paenibacillus humicola]
MAGDCVSLVKPSAGLRDGYMDFYREWKDSGEDMVPWVISREPDDFDAMVQFLHDQEREDHLPGWVPSSTYWLAAGRRIVGAVNIRHRLTERLLQRGGHIGYGIRPSERRKGYATRLLALSLEEARRLGIASALIVCDSWNIASAKTILNNGGVPDAHFTEENGNVIKRFWIPLQFRTAPGERNRR